MSLFLLRCFSSSVLQIHKFSSDFLTTNSRGTKVQIVTTIWRLLFVVGINVRSIPSGFDVSDVVEGLNAEVAIQCPLASHFTASGHSVMSKSIPVEHVRVSS